MTKFDEAIYILIVDLISRKQQFGANNVNLDEITETVKDNIRTSLNKLYLQQLDQWTSKKYHFEAKKMKKYFTINQNSCIFVYQIRQKKKSYENKNWKSKAAKTRLTAFCQHHGWRKLRTTQGEST